MSQQNIFKLTSAVRIQVVLEHSSPDSVTIEIEDPTDTVKVNYLPMIQLSPTVYQYIWQSVSTDEDGDYLVTIKATWGSYTSTDQTTFIMEDID